MCKKILLFLISCACLLRSSELVPRLDQLAAKQCAAIILNAKDFEQSINLAHRGTTIPAHELQPGVKELIHQELAPKVRPISIPLTGHQGPVNSLAWNSEGTKLASAGSDGAVRIWKQNASGSWQNTKELLHANIVTSIAWSPNGQQLAVGSGYDLARASRDNEVYIWQTQDKTLSKIKVGKHKNYVHTLIWAQDGSQLISSSSCGILVHMQAVDGRYISQALAMDPHPVVGFYACSIAMDHDQFQLAIGRGHMVITYTRNQNRFENLTELIDDDRLMSSVAFSPSGTYLTAGSRNGTIALYTKKPDGWDKILLRGPESYRPHNSISSVTWNPNERQFASCSDDKIIRIWTHHDDDSWTDLPLAESITDNEAARVVAWSPDGKNLASGSINGTVNVWPMFQSHNLSLEQLIAVLGASKAKGRGANYARQVFGFLPIAFAKSELAPSDTNLENGLKQLLNGIIPASLSCIIQ